MSTSSVDQVLFVPGKVVINPTSLSVGFPYGGTELGLMKEWVEKPTRSYYAVEAEEFGVEKADVLDLGAAYLIALILRAPSDSSVISTVFPGSTVGAASGDRVVNWPVAPATTTGTYRAGWLLSSRSVVLMFCPLDAERHPATIGYKALPMLDEAAQLQKHLSNPLEYAAVFALIRDSSNRVISSGKVEDLSL